MTSFFLHFLVKLVDLFLNLVLVFRLRIQIQIALVGLDRLFLHASFLLRLAQVAKGKCVAGFRERGVFEAVDGCVHVAFVHVILTHLHVFFRAQRIPFRLIRSILRCVIRIWLGGLRLVCGSRRLVWGKRRWILRKIAHGRNEHKESKSRDVRRSAQ